MPDINLLHDREAEERDKQEQEKQKQKARVLIELTNPEKHEQKESTALPASGFWAFVKDLLTKIKRPRLEGISDLRSQTRRRHPRVEPPAQKPKITVTERYLPKDRQEQAQGVEDIFAPSPPAKEEQESAQPTTIPSSFRTTPPITPEHFGGEVITPPIVPQKKAQAEPTRSVPSAEQGVTPVVGTDGNEPPSSDSFFGVNLVPEEMRSAFVSQNRVVFLGLVALITVLLVATVYVAMSLYENSVRTKAQENRDQISSIDQQLAKLNDTKRSATTFHQETQRLSTLLEEHLYWTKFLSGLEKYTIDTVFYRNVTADEAGRLTVTASTRDYPSVARQLVAFTEATDFVKTVSITSAGARAEQGATLVDFTATIVLADSVFLRNAEGGPTFVIGE